MIFVIVGHGELPADTKHSIELLVGKRDDLFVVSEEEGNDNYKLEIDALLEKHKDDQVMVFSDLIAGASNQYVSKKLKEHDFKLISGYNIPILLETLFMNDPTNIELIEVVDIAKNEIVYVNNIIEDQQ